MDNVMTFQFSPILLAGMVLGLWLLWRRDWRLGVLLGGSVVLFTLVTATYRAPQTVEYMLPAYVVLALLAGYAAADKGDGRWSSSIIRPALSALLLLGALWQFGQRYPSFAWLHHNYDTRNYANEIMEETPLEGLVLADWHWATPLWYMQDVENTRPDSEVHFVFPEGEPYGVTWAKRIQNGLENGHDVVSTHYDAEAFGVLPVSEPIGEAFLFRQVPRETLPEGFTSLSLSLGDAIKVMGYVLDTDNVEIGEAALMTIAWQAVGEIPPGTALFAHLVSEDGRLVGQHDVPARPQETGLTLTQFRVAPQIGVFPGTYTLEIGAYADQPLLGSASSARTALTTITVTENGFPWATKNALRRTLVDSERATLVGYDWDQTIPKEPRLYLHWKRGEVYASQVVDEAAVELPPYQGPWGVASQNWSGVLSPAQGQYVPFGQGIVWTGGGLPEIGGVQSGQQLVLYQRFLSSNPVLRDQAVSVRLIGFAEGGREWAWWDLDDAIPAMGAIPTLKWIEGSVVQSPHFITVDPVAAPGDEVGGALTMYDAFTGRTLPLLDGRLLREYGWVPLGRTNVEG